MTFKLLFSFFSFLFRKICNGFCRGLGFWLWVLGCRFLGLLGDWLGPSTWAACVHLTWSGLSMSTRLPCQCRWVSGLCGSLAQWLGGSVARWLVACKFKPRSKVNNGRQQRKKGQAISVTAACPTARHLLMLVQQKRKGAPLPCPVLPILVLADKITDKGIITLALRLTLICVPSWPGHVCVCSSVWTLAHDTLSGGSAQLGYSSNHLAVRTGLPLRSD